MNKAFTRKHACYTNFMQNASRTSSHIYQRIQQHVLSHFYGQILGLNGRLLAQIQRTQIISSE